MSIKLFGKYFLFPLESLLLVVPAILFFGLLMVYQIFSIDPYISVSVPFILGNNIIVLHLALFVVPYITYRYLRSKGLGDLKIKTLHVLLSLFLLLLILFTYQFVRPTYVHQAIDAFVDKEDKFWMEATITTYLVLGMQILVQVVFLMHSVNLIFPSKPKEPAPELSL